MDAKVGLWDLHAVNPASEPRFFPGNQGRGRTAMFSPDSRWLFTASSDHFEKFAVLIDLTEPDPNVALTVLRGHDFVISYAAFDSDSCWLATGSSDGTVRVWDLHRTVGVEGSIILHGHEGPIHHIGFGREKHWLVTVDMKRAPRLWPLQLSDLIELAKTTAGRNLTPQEWQEYFSGNPYRPTFLDVPAPAFRDTFKTFARNLSRMEWDKLFPGQAYRKTFPNLPEPDGE